jgi:putative membrane protein
MLIAKNFLVILVAGIHLWFLILEMFLFQKPIGLKTFRNSKEKAEMMAPLAANQGLYNGFLAAGLIVSLFLKNPGTAFAFQVYFLICVIVAGLYGAWSVSKKIFFVQSCPGILAMILLLFNLI